MMKLFLILIALDGVSITINTVNENIQFDIDSNSVLHLKFKFLKSPFTIQVRL